MPDTIGSSNARVGGSPLIASAASDCKMTASTIAESASKCRWRSRSQAIHASSGSIEAISPPTCPQCGAAKRYASQGNSRFTHTADRYRNRLFMRSLAFWLRRVGEDLNLFDGGLDKLTGIAKHAGPAGDAREAPFDQQNGEPVDIAPPRRHCERLFSGERAERIGCIGPRGLRRIEDARQRPRGHAQRLHQRRPLEAEQLLARHQAEQLRILQREVDIPTRNRLAARPARLLAARVPRHFRGEAPMAGRGKLAQ